MSEKNTKDSLHYIKSKIQDMSHSTKPLHRVITSLAKKLLKRLDDENQDKILKVLDKYLKVATLLSQLSRKWTFTIHWALTGSHQACNASAAAAAALVLGISPELIAAGLTRTKLPGMRMKITEIAGVCYVNDAYNANPGSMRAGFEWLEEFADPARLILLLGEMREIGES